MNDYVTDPAVLAQLNGGNTDEYVTDPALLAQLNASAPEPGGAAPQFFPTGTGATMPPGVGQFAKDVGTMAQPIGQFAKQYASKPGVAALDLLAGSMLGAPPKATVEGAQAIGETYKNVQDYLGKSGQFKPQSPAGAQAIGNIANQLAPDELAQAAKINQAIGPEGLREAMRPGAKIPTQAPVAGGPAAQEGATFIQRMAAKFGPVAEAVAPVVAKAAPILNTAGRIAGPAGLAYNAYEGAQFAQDAKLGPRLAGGEGKLAQTAFRNMNTQYGAPVSREQAIAVLQSGNQRDIAAFGGEQRLRAIAGQ